jgi:hypothetical protein
MAESDSPNFRSKKRKIEDTNFDEPLLSPPLPENVFPDSQPSGSQTVATEIFDLTLVEPETEKYEDQSVWKKVELQSVSAMLQKLDRNTLQTTTLISSFRALLSSKKNNK